VGANAGAVEGRESELAELLRRTRLVVEQPDRAVLVTGEAGIGKTHLVRRAIEDLAGDGFRVAWGRADPVERGLPYAAITQVLGALQPGLGSALWDANQVSGPDAVLLEIYRPLAGILEAESASQPLVLVIDDLHYADEDTLRVVAFLVRRLVELPIVWLFTARSHVADDTSEVAQLLYQLRQDQRLDEIALGQLADRDIRRLIDTVAGNLVDADERDALVTRAAGNPFFAIQLARAYADAPRRASNDGRIGITSVSGRAALLERVFPLGESARAVARLAAVLGSVDLEQLESFAAVLDLDVEAVQLGFDRLVRADLFRPHQGEPYASEPAYERYEFVHDLVRETLYADLGPGERRRLHGAAAEALLQRRSVGGRVDLVELARHLSASSHGPDARAADALREAGDALVPSSPRSAVGLYRQALEHSPPAAAGTAELQVRLARALYRANEPEEVVRICRYGLEHATGRARDRLTRYLAGALADTGAYADALHLVDGEIATREESAVLLNTRALLLRLLGDYDGAVHTLQHATSVALDAHERLAVTFQRLSLSLDVGRRAEPRTAVAEIERTMPALDTESRLMAHAHLAGAFLGFGENHRVRAQLDEVTRLEAGGARNVDWAWSFAARVGLALQEARFDDALHLYAQDAHEFGTGLRLLTRNHATVALLDVPLLRRDIDGLRTYAADIADVGGAGRPARAFAEGLVDRLAGRFEEAIARFDAALPRTAAASTVRIALLTHCALTHEERGATDTAREVLDALRETAAEQDSPYARVLHGMLAVRVGADVATGESALEEAVEHGMIEYEAALRIELGRRGVAPEVNLSRAYPVVRSAGAVDYIAVAEAAMREQGVRVPTRRRDDGLALTDAEQRVAGLVAEGLTNKAIAERLSYSVKTIEAYLSRVYAKTGCTNRVELARHLAAPKP
jgi:DNA-binding CsgD family transcriptional regulator/tetratricopeptide (TPR) repeat protein